MRPWKIFLLVLVGCPVPLPRPTPPDVPPDALPGPALAGLRLAHEPSVEVTLRAPSRVPYVAEALGIGGQSVSVQLTNTGSRDVHVERFRIAFAATRDRVHFPCTEHAGGAMKEREPTSLASGSSFVFTRDIDCTMPLPGRYDVGVYVALTDVAPTERGDFVGTFPLEVVSTGPLAPRAYPSHPGLYAAMTGSRGAPPLPAEAWARGDYFVVVTIVNASRSSVPVGPARLSFLTYKKGSPLPCSGQAAPVSFPAELASGAVHFVRAPVACAPSDEGRYEIVGKLTLVGDGEGIEIGRVALKVSRDPLLFDPEPWIPPPDLSTNGATR
jgi:hypothetical protein